MNNIKVRIAPSPSGYLHVGTARTAIFNWLYARHHDGKFVVRIEDTDQSRSDSDLIQPILDSMKWLGLDWDEEPCYQSQRLDSYLQYIDKLLENGHAYRCFCTPDELDQKRKKAMAEKRNPLYDRTCLDKSDKEISDLLEAGKPFTTRLKIPDGETVFEDMVLGTISKQNAEIEDLIICRADGRAVYNLAVVIDDFEMGITDVIRGNDHINNTFKQIHIYRGLKLDPPRFGHLPLLLRPDKRKVSKRLGDKDVAEYGAEGILPEAMFNFLCLLGWSPKDDREYLEVDELIRIFSLENVNKSNPIFDETKLEAINYEHLRRYPDYKLAQLVAPKLVEAGVITKYWLESRWDYLLKVIALLKERCRRVNDFVSQGGYFFDPEFEYDPKAVKKRFSPIAAEYLEKIAAEFSKLEVFSKANLENIINEMADSLDVKKGALIHPTRLAVAGVPAGPGLYDILETIGKDQVIMRLKRAVEYINKRGGNEDVQNREVEKTDS
jgi:glutamyl-tRNA synthetase